MPNKPLILAGLAVAAFGALIWLGQAKNRANQLRAVTVYSRHNQSLSLFREWKKAVHGQSVTIHHKAFLFPDDLSAFDGIMIASPRRPIAAREARVLATYVRRGGRLLLSAHDTSAYEHFQWLLDHLEINGAIAPHLGFTPKQVAAVTPAAGTALFEAGKPYGFYSLIQFSDSACEPHSLDCFARIIEVEQGKVLLILGLPLLANAMVSHLSNVDFTLAVGRWAPHLLIDEYHHFFTEKTWQDLLAQAEFTIPLVGMIAGLVLFFLFGYSPFHERPVRRTLARTYHELNENIVRKFLRDPTMAGEALEQQRQFLLRQFPQQTHAINDLAQRAGQQCCQNPKALARGLGEFVRFHQEQLKSRGRRETE
jgi:hypothetical protein